jgi:phosphoesterase RecJ-like protein
MFNMDEILQNVHSVGIGGHVRPDGDCVGSCLGVYNYFRTYYPNMDVHVYLEQIPDTFTFLENADKIEQPKGDEQHDLFIALDCGDLKRLGDTAKIFTNAKKTACVDHHISNESFADLNHVIPDASSTCELVYHLLPKVKITKAIAECLYTGMVTDTGCFQYSCTSSETMNAAGVLMDKGIDYTSIIHRVFYSVTYVQNQVLGYALLHSKLWEDGKIITTILTQEDLKRFGAGPHDMESVVSSLRNTAGVEVAIFLHENEDGSYKGSSRATGDVNLSEVAAKFHGGGHAKAAGFTVYGDPEEALQEVITEIKKRL